MSSTITSLSYGKNYLITLPEELRNFSWSNSWGKIQMELRSLSSEVECIIINAERLEWVDPFPILSILIGMAELHKTHRICFVLTELDKASESQKRVMEFLEKEGFLSAMIELGIAILLPSQVKSFTEGESHISSSSLIESIQKQLNGFVIYDNCTILKARIVDLAQYRGENQIDSMVEKELEQVKHRIRPHLPESLMNEMLWKTGLFLKETINNVYEHAYDGKKNKYVGFYIRCRRGLMDNSLDSNTHDALESQFYKEYQDVACFVWKFPVGVVSFLEVFVLDAGVGLTSHYTLRKSSIKKSFKEVWRETIGLGNRSSNIKKNTKFGGLYTLGRLLQNECLISRDYDFWIGDILPIQGENSSYRSAKENDDCPAVEGLALMCRLSINKPMDNNGWLLTEESVKCLEDALKEEAGIYEKYYNSSFKKLGTPLSYIKDNRFDLRFIEKRNDYLEQKKNVKFCVFLPSEHISKNEIYHYIESLKSFVSIGSRSGSRAVIIADIPVNECGLYQHALENAHYKDDFTKVVDRIVLLSQRLSAYVLIKNEKEKTYVFSKKETKSFISHRPIGFAPHMSLFNCIEWLKTHDSMLVWQYIISKNNTEKFFVNQEVTWYKEKDEKKLLGYLDFEKTLTDPFLKKVYKNALLRTLCFSRDSRCKYVADDPLMTGLADYMNTLYYNAPDTASRGQIALGSVYVSGATQSNDVAYNVNVFLHKDSALYVSSNTVLHLFAWPEKDLFPPEEKEDDIPYKRVGATYAIAPFGWRYFPIPRYKALDADGNIIKENKYIFRGEEMKDISFRSIYKCPPKETYAYWQGKNGLFVGVSHVDYETKHDILNINFPFIVKESFLLGGDLATFLLGEIVAAFDLNIDDVDFQGNVKFRDDVKEYVERKKEEFKQRVCTILVYPYHSNTERIMDILNEYLREAKIITVPLIPINKERNGTTFQPSPLTIEMLRKAIQDKAQTSDGRSVEVNALFFDDSIVDGRTQDEIKHILYGLGVKYVFSLFLLERRRIPFNTSDFTQSSVFWRLDIPRLGSKYNCPLCSALSAISDFSHQLISDNAKKRVSEWKEAWIAKTESSLDRIQTIVPMNIHLDHPRKRFGIYFEDGECKQCGGDDNRIEILTSFGLSLYMGELLSVTSRDDKMLQYCEEKYHLDAFSILEMLCTNLLLYGRTISRKVRERIVQIIFRQANEISETSNHTAFASLVLMTQEREVLVTLKSEYEGMIRSNRRPNYDMLILLSYLGVHYPQDFDQYKDPGELREITLTNDKAYRLFHSEVYNGDGRTHNRPIGRLIDNAIGSTQDLRRVEDALDCLLYALDHIFDWALSDWDEKNKASVEGTKKLIREKKKLFDNLDWDGYISDSDKYRKEMSELQETLSRLHQRMYLPLNLINNNKAFDSTFLLHQRIQSLAQSLKGVIDVGFFGFDRLNVGYSHINERWITWDRYIDDEFYFLLRNAQDNSSGSFSMDKKENHKVWLSTKYDLDKSTLSILIFNKALPGKNASYVRRETSKKSRYGKLYLAEEMSVKVEYRDLEENVLQTQVIFKLI